MCGNPSRCSHGAHARGTSHTGGGGACKTLTHRRATFGLVLPGLVKTASGREDLQVACHNIIQKSSAGCKTTKKRQEIIL